MIMSVGGSIMPQGLECFGRSSEEKKAKHRKIQEMKLAPCFLFIKVHKTLIKLDQAAVFKTYYVMMDLLLI